MKKYYLFLDDVRMPADCIHYMRNTDYTNLSWTIVRSHDEFVKCVEDRYANEEFPQIVSFDHDLADEHYDPKMYHGVDSYNEASTQFKEATGKHCADWLVQFCIDNEIDMPICLIHSMNPAGVERIKKSIEDYERYTSRL
jgi:hypothetical protein